MNATTNSLQARTESLVALTGGKAEWFATRKQITSKECELGLVWDGALEKHVSAAQPKPFRTSTGMWAIALHGSNKATLLTEAECVKLGLENPNREMFRA